MKPCILTLLTLLLLPLWLAPLPAHADPVADEQVAIAAERNGDDENALQLYQSAYSGYSELQQYQPAARVAQSLMLLQISLGDIEGAVESSLQAREMLRQGGKPDVAARLASQLASVLKARSEYELAEESYLSALEIYRELANAYGEAGSLMSLGVLLELKLDPAGSAEYYEQAGDVFLSLGDERGLMNSYASAGQAWLSAGNSQRAEQAFRQSLFLCGKLDDPLGCVKQKLGLSRALREMEQLAEAGELNAECLATLADFPDQHLLARTQLERGRILAAQENHADSLSAMIEAWELFASGQLAAEQAAMAEELIRAAQAAGRTDIAERYRQQSRLLNASS